MFRSIYAFILSLAVLGIRFLALFDSKMAKAVAGRRQKIQSPTLKEGQKVVWMHCASLGEFEQGKSLLLQLKEKDPKLYLVISFFSPSGYEAAKYFEEADQIVYMPWDLHPQVRDFISTIKPDLVIFVKYDFWYQHIRLLNEWKIPLVFIATLIRPNHFLLKKVGAPFRKELKKIHCIYTQDKASARLLTERGFENVKQSGDSRVDSVFALKAEERADPLVANFARSDDRPLLIIGSSWQKDLEILAAVPSATQQKFKWLIAPHEIRKNELEMLKRQFPALRMNAYSKIKEPLHLDLILLDVMGTLKYLYRYAEIAYIGGGFGAGIHNTLEPAVYGLPVILGPRYHKFPEAVSLIEQEAFFCIRTAQELNQILFRLQDSHERKKASLTIDRYMAANRHVVDEIARDLKKLLYFGPENIGKHEGIARF